MLMTRLRSGRSEGFRSVNPGRGAPPFLIPQAKYLSTRVSFTPADLGAARRAMACHKTQFTEEVVQRVSEAMGSALQEGVPLVPAFSGAGATDVFQ
jgi:hypothetical protein